MTFKAFLRSFSSGVLRTAWPTKHDLLLPPTTFSTLLLLPAVWPGAAQWSFALTALAGHDGFVTCGRRQPGELGEIFHGDPEWLITWYTPISSFQCFPCGAMWPLQTRRGVQVKVLGERWCFLSTYLTGRTITHFLFWATSNRYFLIYRNAN